MDAGGALSLYGEAIARLWLLLMSLYVASSTFSGSIAGSGSIVAFDSVALRELVELKEAAVVVGGLMPRLRLLISNITAVVLLLVLLLHIEEIHMRRVLQEPLLKGRLLLVVELLARTMALGLRCITARLHVVEQKVVVQKTVHLTWPFVLHGVAGDPAAAGAATDELAGSFARPLA